MDENAKTQFKWKFYRLTIELNIIVLLVAMSILVYFFIHSSSSIVVIFGMLALALLLLMDFFKKYRETKAWLDDNTGKETDHKKESEL